MAADREDRSTVHAAVATASVVGVFVAISVAVLIGRIFTAARTPILWTLAGVILTVLLLPAVQLLGRWIPRVVAAALILLLLAGAYLVIGYRFVDDLGTGVDLLQQRLPEAATDLEQGNSFLHDIELSTRVREFVDQLPNESIQVSSAAATLATFLVSGTLTLFLLLYGPRMFDAGFGQIRDERRRTELRRVALVAIAKTERYATGSLIGMVVFGLVTYLIARLTDLPAPTPLAVVAGVLSALPYFGLVLGALPVLLLSAGLNSPREALVLAAVYVGLQVAQVVLWRLWLQPRSLYIGPAVIAVVGLLGYDLYGIGGLLFGTVIGIFLIALGDAAASTSILSGSRPPVTEEPEPVE